MGRLHRIIKENTDYHVYNKINNHRSLNLATDTFNYFRYLLIELKREFDLNIYGFCLMTNHYHIQIRTNKANLDQAMKFFGERYARYINKHTNATGPVFSSRYKAKEIANEAYFLQVLRYIHLNPVEAGLCKYPEEYIWSSMYDYTNGTFTVVELDEILDKFISLDDFIHYHYRGNSRLIKRFYSKKHVPNMIDKTTVI